MQKRIEDLKRRRFKMKGNPIHSTDFKAIIYFHPEIKSQETILLKLNSHYPKEQNFLEDKKLISELGYEIFYPKNRFGFILFRKSDETFWGVIPIKDEDFTYFLILDNLPNEETF